MMLLVVVVVVALTADKTTDDDDAADHLTWRLHLEHRHILTALQSTTQMHTVRADDVTLSGSHDGGGGVVVASIAHCTLHIPHSTFHIAHCTLHIAHLHIA